MVSGLVSESVVSVRSVLANMTLWRTNLGYGGLSENSCMHPGKTTLALWSSMLIFFKRNAMSVRSKGGHPVYKSSTERDGEKTLSLRRQWDTFLYSPTDQKKTMGHLFIFTNRSKKQWDTFYLHQQNMIKGQNLWCQNGRRSKCWTTPTGCFWVLPFRRALFLIKISVVAIVAFNPLWFNEHNSFLNWGDLPVMKWSIFVSLLGSIFVSL